MTADRTTAEKEGDEEWAREAKLKEIEEGRRTAFNAAINVCGKAGRWDRALALLFVSIIAYVPWETNTDICGVYDRWHVSHFLHHTLSRFIMAK